VRKGKAKMVNDSKVFDYGGKKVNTTEDDSDTLQILDESDREWVRLWRNATSKEVSQAIRLKTTVFSPEEPATTSLQTRTRR
jgi:inorganic pyrophosphatase/exopolyphosphatase